MFCACVCFQSSAMYTTAATDAPSFAVIRGPWRNTIASLLQPGGQRAALPAAVPFAMIADIIELSEATLKTKKDYIIIINQGSSLRLPAIARAPLSYLRLLPPCKIGGQRIPLSCQKTPKSTNQGNPSAQITTSLCF